MREIQWVNYPEDYDRLVAALNLRAGRKSETKKEEEKKKKEPKPRTSASPKNSGGPNIVVHGNINVGGDFISRDQYKTVNHNETTNNISSQADFVSALNQLKAEIEALKSQPGIEPKIGRASCRERV